jgi:hypothetical protein
MDIDERPILLRRYDTYKEKFYFGRPLAHLRPMEINGQLPTEAPFRNRIPIMRKKNMSALPQPVLLEMPAFLERYT